MSSFLMSTMNMTGRSKTRMPKYKSDLYVNDIYVTTYYADVDNEEEAFDFFNDAVRNDLFLDIEEIDA